MDIDAILLTLGYSQNGIDYDETFNPVVRSESLYTVIVLAAMIGLTPHQMDITSYCLSS